MREKLAALRAEARRLRLTETWVESHRHVNHQLAGALASLLGRLEGALGDDAGFAAALGSRQLAYASLLPAMEVGRRAAEGFARERRKVREGGRVREQRRSTFLSAKATHRGQQSIVGNLGQFFMQNAKRYSSRESLESAAAAAGGDDVPAAPPVRRDSNAPADLPRAIERSGAGVASAWSSSGSDRTKGGSSVIVHEVHDDEDQPGPVAAAPPPAPAAAGPSAEERAIEERRLRAWTELTEFD